MASSNIAMRVSIRGALPAMAAREGSFALTRTRVASLFSAAALSIGALMIPLSSAAGSPPRSTASADHAYTITTPHGTLEQRGKQLRAAIDQRYAEMVRTNALHTNPMERNSLDEIVLKFIPLGSSFDDAEQILRAARFKVDPRPPVNAAGTRPDRYDVAAYIEPYLDKFPSRTSIYVSLSPSAPGDYGTIAKLSADITISYP